MWTVTKVGKRFEVAKGEETYRHADKRRAMTVAQGRARGTMTPETAKRLEGLDRQQYQYR